MKELKTILKIALIAMTLVLLTSCESEPIESNESVDLIKELLSDQWELKVSSDTWVEITLTLEGSYFMYITKRTENGYSNRRIVREGLWFYTNDTIFFEYINLSLDNEYSEFSGQFEVNNDTLKVIDVLWTRMN
tara:strand:- start:402 stop:803 length:402 start_codon:yes stop_codon:yes gene_type:complete